MANTPEQKLNAYLAELRNFLHLDPGLGQEIIEELRSHVYECAVSHGQLTDVGVTAALERLGPPRDLAARYTSECLAVPALTRRPGLQIVRRLCDWATIGPAGLFLVLGSLAGYYMAAALALCSIRKLFAPDRAGLWQMGESVSLRLGFTATPPAEGTELLGWWIIPLGLTTGIGLILLTTRLGFWSLRSFRQLRTH